MKRLFLIVFAALLSLSASAQIAEAWIAMPDSLCPYLTQQQRYALIQFAEAGQNDSLQNSFGGYSHVDTLDLNAGLLSIRMTANMRWTITIVPDTLPRPSKGQDNGTGLCIMLTSTICAPLCQSIFRYYDLEWNLLAVRHEPFIADPTDEDKEQQF